MNAHTPPSFWASAITWYMSVVLPEDSGPKTSTIRPRGTPPMPSARSSDSAPVGIALTFTWAPSSPIRMTVPLPNWRSICVSAPCRAASRALAAFSSGGVGMGKLLNSGGSVVEPTFGVGRNPTVRTAPRNEPPCSSRGREDAAAGALTLARKMLAMSTTTDFGRLRPQLDATRLDRIVRAALTMALAAVLVAMLVVLVAGLSPATTLVVLFFAGLVGGGAGAHMAWKRTA